jgi:hypothetical protein
VIPVAHIARVSGRENDTPLPADPAASIADWSLVGRGAGGILIHFLTANKKGVGFRGSSEGTAHQTVSCCITQISLSYRYQFVCEDLTSPSYHSQP